MDDAEDGVSAFPRQPVQSPDQHQIKLTFSGISQQPDEFFLMTGFPARLLLMDTDNLKTTPLSL
jgi:hypothetical protein